jgi:hypothetical protein
MIGKRIFVPVCAVLLVLGAHDARCGTPVSANGFGAEAADNYGRSRGMGGAGLAADDGWSMLRGNPALISTFKKPIYGIGFIFNRIDTKPAGESSLTFARTDPNYVKLVLPLYKGIALGWNLSPVTLTGVKLAMPSSPGDTFTDTVDISGGLNVSSFELAGGYKAVRAGVSLDYYFGTMEEQWTRDFHGAAGVNNSLSFLEREYKGYGVTVGGLAKVTRRVSLGFGYSKPTLLDRSIHFKPGSQDAADILIGQDHPRLPAVWRFGTYSTLSENLTCAADVVLSRWTDEARTDHEKLMYTDTAMFGGGFRYIPSVRSLADYVSTIPLSAGFRAGNLYYRSWPKIGIVREMALTFGVELPFRGGGGGLVTSFEIGKRGSTSSNGWDETFANIGVSLQGAIK